MCKNGKVKKSLLMYSFAVDVILWMRTFVKLSVLLFESDGFLPGFLWHFQKPFGQCIRELNSAWLWISQDVEKFLFWPLIFAINVKKLSFLEDVTWMAASFNNRQTHSRNNTMTDYQSLSKRLKRPGKCSNWCHPASTTPIRISKQTEHCNKTDSKQCARIHINVI